MSCGSGAGLPGKQGTTTRASVSPKRWQGTHLGARFVKEVKVVLGKREKIQYRHWGGHHSAAWSGGCRNLDAGQMEERSI